MTERENNQDAKQYQNTKMKKVWIFFKSVICVYIYIQILWILFIILARRAHHWVTRTPFFWSFATVYGAVKLYFLVSTKCDLHKLNSWLIKKRNAYFCERCIPYSAVPHQMLLFPFPPYREHENFQQFWGLCPWIAQILCDLLVKGDWRKV